MHDFKNNAPLVQVQFEITSIFSDEIVLHSIQLPLHYIHFEIAQFDSHKMTKFWSVPKFAKQKLQNLPNNGTFLYHFDAM